jgi:hypothetical protein
MDLEWLVISGRRVSHGFPRGRGPRAAVCGQTSEHSNQNLYEDPEAPHCLQCRIQIVTGISWMTSKFFEGYIPQEVRARRRKLWRESLTGNVNQVDKRPTSVPSTGQ